MKILDGRANGRQTKCDQKSTLVTELNTLVLYLIKSARDILCFVKKKIDLLRNV